MLTCSYACEYKNITFIAIDPGWVDTDMGRSGGQQPPLTIETSTRGLAHMIDTVTHQQTGKMLRFVALCALAAVGYSAQIVVIGDSWAAGAGRTAFQAMAQRHGLTVDNIAIGGTTAAYWAARPNALRDAVARNPDALWVWLTIGGNDASAKLARGVPIPQIVAEAIADTSAFLRPLFAVNNRIRVVQFGYDLLTFSLGICPAAGLALFPHCLLNTECINRDFVQLQFAYVEALSRLFPQHDNVNLLGSMQQAGGIPGASPGFPVMSQYSPNHLMADCIHPNAQGYTAVFNAFWNAYWAKQLNATESL